ncbi:hypothetical protein [Lysinibacillus xylanilyticus]|uniref:Uncharacterized protein n=1 Tax=Lysinibacillus xylanilyticus TaxID=582475 RepID=A0ABT4EMH4_9BACI|nr:hypothetical protein [Lysinibacillus xylanilyticus]MCY9546864.1 hypothetical protein [Lysinibacillus xylanilyticus]
MKYQFCLGIIVAVALLSLQKTIAAVALLSLQKTVAAVAQKKNESGIGFVLRLGDAGQVAVIAWMR